MTRASVQAVKVDRKDLPMLLLLGRCEESRGEAFRAKDTYERAVKLDPDGTTDAAAGLARVTAALSSHPTYGAPNGATSAVATEATVDVGADEVQKVQILRAEGQRVIKDREEKQTAYASWLASKATVGVVVPTAAVKSWYDSGVRL